MVYHSNSKCSQPNILRIQSENKERKNKQDSHYYLRDNSRFSFNSSERTRKQHTPENPIAASHSAQDDIFFLILHEQFLYHRIRIYTEEKAKVVAAVLGTELIQFLAALQI